MRKLFAETLFKKAQEDNRIIIITADLGYKMWDKFRDELPSQFLNIGASEFGGCCISVGLACQGFIPFYYSITPFLLYRSFEAIRNYINRERIPVKLCGSGRDKDYEHDGFSHWCEEAKEVLNIFPNIVTLWPDTKEEIPKMVDEMIKNDKPYFISLKR